MASSTIIVILNKGGGAIVAEKDGSIVPVVINKKIYPAAFVVGTHDLYPWEKLIQSFFKICRNYTGVSELARNFVDYANKSGGIAEYMQSPAFSWDLLLCGYEEEEIFPSAIQIGMASSGMPLLGIEGEQKVTFRNPVVMMTSGDTNAISPVLSGVSTEIYESCITFYEKHNLSNADRFKENLGQLNSLYRQNLVAGIDTFDIQDMIDAGEALLNTNLRLMKLKTGEETGAVAAGEIAVLTKTEGLTWIKHSTLAF